MIRLGPDLLTRSPQETTRHLCLQLLEEADLALLRFERGEGGESLHDFRVALRRLRSVLRAYRPYLEGAMRKKRRNQLRELASRTNQARDFDVQIDWLATQAPGLDPESRAGAEELRARLESRQRAFSDLETLRRDFDRLRVSSKKSFSQLRLRLEELGPSFLSATGEVLSEASTAAKKCLARIQSSEDVAELHRARLAAKRLRYVLEPLGPEVAGARTLVNRVKLLQDLLGELQDVHVLTTTTSEELSQVALDEAQRLRDLALRDVVQPEPVPLQSQFLALLRVQRERRERAYRELARAWLGESPEPFFRAVSELAERLTSSGASRRPRRRFLLRGVPEEARQGVPSVIREGFLPGKRIRESVRAIQSDGSKESRVRYRRMVEAPGTLPIEESLDRTAFEKLWPLTEGRRSERFRFELDDGTQRWLIDSLAEGELVLAEVEPSPDFEIPGWLKPFVLREVTGRKKYAPEKLAGVIGKRARSAPGTPVDPRDEPR